jgi:hypothetical protein
MSSLGNSKKDDERNPFYIPDVGRVDPRSIGSIYGVPAKSKGPDYIPYNARGRDITSRLFFNSGAFWLSGFTAGSLYGFQEGWRGAASPIVKIRFNSVMNAMSKRGSTLGNGLGVIGIRTSNDSFSHTMTHPYLISTITKFVAFYHTAAVWLADTLQLEEITGSPITTPIFAGFTVGITYKSAAGIRGAALSGVVGKGHNRNV